MNPFEFSEKGESLYAGLGLSSFSSFTSESVYQNPFEGKEMVRTLPGRLIVFEASRKENRYAIGGRKTALAILAYNRPSYLLKTFNQVAKVLSDPSNMFYVDIVISQDGNDNTVKNLIETIKDRMVTELPFCSFLALKHKRMKTEIDSDYSMISQHITSVFNSLFFEHNYDQVILLDVWVKITSYVG